MKTKVWTRLLVAVSWFSLLAAPVLAANEKNEHSKAADAAQYAGSDVCLTCHEDVYKKQFEGTPHFQTLKKDGHGCESCHGPGAEHVAGGGDKTEDRPLRGLVAGRVQPALS